ncbi:MAG: response regulator [Candidatus Omnitrophica bacterium]|nr:response regulator [Candidatus Omnitrophota bacterium]
MDEIRKKFSRPLKVLVIEDNVIDQKILESMLTEPPAIASFLKIAGKLSEGIKLVNEFPFEIAILDLNLPDSQGIETITVFSRHALDLAIVVNTGVYEDDLGLETLKHGAQDFLIKSKYNSYVLNKVLHYCLERKQRERDLVNAYHELKEAQQHLIDSEKFKIVGRLAGGVAHEVKNPLATISYGITYLQQNLKTPDSNQLKVMENIKEAADRADKIVNDLLDFSSLDQFQKTPASIQSVIRKAISLVQYQLDEKQIQLIEIFTDDHDRVMIDKNRIGQVVINLILNAAHAVPPHGEIQISTHLSAWPDLGLPGSWGKPDLFASGEKIVVIRIEDNGVGIPENVLDKIFEPFFTSRRAAGGTGLGLSICRNIMEHHEAGIKIFNRPEGGVCAALCFRALSQAQEDEYAAKKDLNH